MSASLATDNRGLLLPCPACGTVNRIAFAKLDRHGHCGSCRADLPKIAAPADAFDSAAFAALVAQSPLPVVVDFWAPWCGPCQMMAPEFAKAAALAAGEAIFLKVNTDEQPEIAAQFRIQGIPAFALIRQGRLAAQTSGFQPAARLIDWLRRA